MITEDQIRESIRDQVRSALYMAADSITTHREGMLHLQVGGQSVLFTVYVTRDNAQEIEDIVCEAMCKLRKFNGRDKHGVINAREPNSF